MPVGEDIVVIAEIVLHFFKSIQGFAGLTVKNRSELFDDIAEFFTFDADPVNQELIFDIETFHALPDFFQPIFDMLVGIVFD